MKVVVWDFQPSRDHPEPLMSTIAVPVEKFDSLLKLKYLHLVSYSFLNYVS